MERTSIAKDSINAELAAQIGEALRKRGLTIATAESCTGGGIAAALTSVAGSSDYFRGGIVAYQIDVKERLLGVSLNTINEYGVVSEETASEMARGAAHVLDADCAVTSTGISGPGGAEPGKPVGTIWLCFRVNGESNTLKLDKDYGSRTANTAYAVTSALRLILENIRGAE